MHRSLFSNAVLLSSLFFTGILASTPNLVVRQDAASAASATPVPAAIFPAAMTEPECLDYSMTANFSVVATNNTLRTAFLQASPVGVMFNSQMLDRIKARWPPMITDVALNSICGNLTAVAFAESDRNLSQRIVLQFGGVAENPAFVQAGLEVVVICLGMVVFFFGYLALI